MELYNAVVGIFAVAFGLGIGSFLNVVILRTHSEDTLMGRSACMHCQHQLAWYMLLPVVSYVALGGKCYYCHKPISAQYPLVEASTAAIFFILANMYWADPVRLVFYCLYSSILVVIFVFDLKYYLIPDRFTIPGIVVAIIGSIILGLTWWQIGLGIVIGGGLFLLQYALSRGKWIGGGDIRLGAVMGAMLGWPYIMVALFIAYVGGAIIAVGLMLTGSKKFSDKLPFGTFLSVATIITLMAGEIILHWYVHDILHF